MRGLRWRLMTGGCSNPAKRMRVPTKGETKGSGESLGRYSQWDPETGGGNAGQPSDFPLEQPGE